MTFENTSLLSEQLVDMKFITAFTGLTDKWFYKMVSFLSPLNWGEAHVGLKVKWNNGCNSK